MELVGSSGGRPRFQILGKLFSVSTVLTILKRRLDTGLQKLSDAPHPREVEEALREHRLYEGVDEEDLGGVDEHGHREDVGGHLVLLGGTRI